MTEPRVSKHPSIDVNDNEEGQCFDKYKSKGDRYILFPFLSQKESNCAIDLGKETRKLNYLVYIPKFGPLDNY